ncbi:GroES-like protein [Trametes meyenii]|nr:GroES-like protein [Trametes meyenii]
MSIPTQQKALFLLEKQGSFTVQATDVPAYGADDILVKVEAAALNPVDWKIHTFGLFVEDFPAIIGAEAAGTVIAVGGNVANFKVGDRVAAQNVNRSRATSAFQQYIALPAALTVKLPSNISLDEAGGLAAGANCAALGLYNKHPDATGFKLVAPWEEGGRGAYAGKPIVILGGASTVGQNVIQFARLSGFSPIITTASPRNAEFVKLLGATHVVDRSLPANALRSAIVEISGGALERVFDAISIKETQNLAYDIAAPGATVMLVLPDEVDAAKKADGKNVKVFMTFGVVAPPQNVEFAKVFVKELAKLVADGSIKPNPPEVLPGGLHAVAGGLEKLKAGKVSAKKLVVRPSETA